LQAGTHCCWIADFTQNNGPYGMPRFVLQANRLGPRRRPGWHGSGSPVSYVINPTDARRRPHENEIPLSKSKERNARTAIRPMASRRGGNPCGQAAP
jgi:hypothetical protein